ncbi:MAG: hypothetical protein AABZ74_03570, partial [Cyanobacteriota bacterium]
MSMSIRSPLSDYKQAFNELKPQILADGKIDKKEVEKLKDLTKFLPPEQKTIELKNIDNLVQSVNNKTHSSEPNRLSFDLKSNSNESGNKNDI